MQWLEYMTGISAVQWWSEQLKCPSELSSLVCRAGVMTSLCTYLPLYQELYRRLSGIDPLFMICFPIYIDDSSRFLLLPLLSVVKILNTYGRSVIGLVHLLKSLE